MDFDFLRPEFLWIIAGLIIMCFEFAIPGVILVFFGLGAIITGIFAWTGLIDSLTGQATCFVVSSVLMLVSLRRVLSRHFRGRVEREEEYFDAAEYTGKTARVTRRIGPGSTEGRIDFEGSEWKAVADEPIAEGRLVEIVNKANITYVVRPVATKGY